MINLNKQSFPLPESLSSEKVRIERLIKSDFERLFAVANDPLLWEQHPNPDRYRRDVFEVFFKGAIESESAFLVFDANTNDVIGSTRFYDFNEKERSIFIGYTFIARSHWGKGFNPALKQLMLNYAYNYVDIVLLHIGAENIRSQKAAERIGAVKIAEKMMEYYGESEKLNFLYEIRH